MQGTFREDYQQKYIVLNGIYEQVKAQMMAREKAISPQVTTDPRILAAIAESNRKREQRQSRRADYSYSRGLFFRG
jgi:hypothetical protein